MASKAITKWLSVGFLLLFGLSAYADSLPGLLPALGAEADFLDAEQAFQQQHYLTADELVLHWEIADGYYLYKHKTGLRFSPASNEQAAIQQVLPLPEGEKKTDDYLGEIESYRKQLTLRLPRPSADAVIAHITYQGCADAGLCYPPQTQRWLIRASSDDLQQAPPSSAPASSTAPSTALTQQPAAASGILWALVFAFLGGMILNLMPCVFPVLSIKLMQIASHKSDSHAKQQGIAYFLGCVCSFIVIAALMLGLRQAGEAIGWGFQLQSPWFVALLIYLFFVLGLSLSGFWHIGESWMGAGQNLTTGNNNRSAFFTGVLAVVVASPCTAPFMGGALGAALTQPAALSLSIFAALGAGLAFPLTLISFIPRLASLLPKPGAWMETVKELFAFPLYATSIWLLWVLIHQSGANAAASVLAGCLLIGIGLWLKQKGRTASHKILCSGLILAALSLPFGAAVNPDPQASPALSYSEPRLTALRKQGTGVFLDFTASWCITCLANEQRVLKTETIQRAFAERDIQFMVGDWTRHDPEITRFLNRFNRNGVPLYVFYPPGTDSEPVVLPQILTVDGVLSTLQTKSAGE